MLQSIRILVVAVALIAAACGGSSESSVPSSQPVEPQATTTTASGLGSATVTASDVSVGAPCPASGALELSADGEQLLCSDSTWDGDPLESPQWRVAAGRNFSENQTLSDAEIAALALIRNLAVEVASVSDRDVLIMVAEYARAVEISADAQYAVDETLGSLVAGVQESTDLSPEAAYNLTGAMIAASTFLLETGSDGYEYALDILEWIAGN